jgi:hypothetical protein
LALYLTSKKHDAWVQKFDSQTVLSSDFSVLVCGLPKTAREDTLKAHFEQWGDVRDIKLSLVGATSIFDALHAKGATSRSERQKTAENPLMSANVKLITESAGGVDKRVIEEAAAAEILTLAQDTNRDCSGFAVVSFETSDTKLIVLSDYSCWTPFLACLHKREITHPDNGLFEGAVLDVVQAPSAGEIHWENFEYGLGPRIKRNIVTSLSLFLLMMMCSSLLVAVQIANKWRPGGNDFGVTVGSTIGTIVANVTIFAVAPAIVAKFEKHHMASHQENSLLLKILLFQLVNSIAISVCSLFSSKSGEFDHAWYDTGSFVVLMTMAGDLVAIGMFVEGLRPDIVIMQQCIAPRAKTQETMNSM